MTVTMCNERPFAIHPRKYIYLRRIVYSTRNHDHKSPHVFARVIYKTRCHSRGGNSAHSHLRPNILTISMLIKDLHNLLIV